MGISDMLRTVRRRTGRGDDIYFRVGEDIYTKQDLVSQEEIKDVIRTPNYNIRVMFYKKGCSVCPKWIKAIKRHNMRALPKDRIKRVELGSPHPLYQEIQPENAPTVIIDGVKIVGATSVKGQEGFLDGFFEDEIVVH